jgi:hypothetical protein
VILHSLNNGIVVFLAYYQPTLSSYAWFPGEEESIPRLWVVAGFVVAATGFILVRYSMRASALPENSSNATLTNGDVL